MVVMERVSRSAGVAWPERCRLAHVFAGLAGVSIGQTAAPAECASARGERGSRGDDVVDKIHRQGLHRTRDADDGVLTNRKPGKAA